MGFADFGAKVNKIACSCLEDDDPTPTVSLPCFSGEDEE
jgi:hypothetical protein